MAFLGNPKNVFWEAFLLAIIVFALGLFIGYSVENSRIEKVNDYYINSEILLIDALTLNNLADSGDFSCPALGQANIDFADRIYEEAKVLDRYDEANKLGDDIRLVHKRYDLLRTLLWSSAMRTRESCEGGFSVVVYLYERETSDLIKKATQNVWSKVLTELKQEKGSNILLIPISMNSDLASLDSLVKSYGVKDRLPVVIINDEVIYELSGVEDLEPYID